MLWSNHENHHRRPRGGERRRKHDWLLGVFRGSSKIVWKKCIAGPISLSDNAPNQIVLCINLKRYIQSKVMPFLIYTRYFPFFTHCALAPRCAVIFEAIITQEDHCCCQLFPINIAPKMFLLCTSFCFVYFGKVYCRFLRSPLKTIGFRYVFKYMCIVPSSPNWS